MFIFQGVGTYYRASQVGAFKWFRVKWRSQSCCCFSPGFCIRGSISFGKLRSQAVGGRSGAFGPRRSGVIEKGGKSGCWWSSRDPKMSVFFFSGSLFIGGIYNQLFQRDLILIIGIPNCHGCFFLLIGSPISLGFITRTLFHRDLIRSF